MLHLVIREGLVFSKTMRSYPLHRLVVLFSFHRKIANATTLTIPEPIRHHFSSNAGSTKLSKQQEQILEAISDGQSVFITGSAGTGKSFLLQEAIKLLQKLHNPHEVFVTASTGVAACALNGSTLHSFAGAHSGIGEGDKNLLLTSVSQSRQASKRWRVAKALVIDEVSMISGEFLDTFEYVARKIRKKQPPQIPWGGIQLIVSGDFFQLSPIRNSPDSSSSSSSVKEFAFEAECWNRTFDLQVELTEVFRQSDPKLIELLQGIRKGRKDAKLLQILRHCLGKSEEADVQVPRLYPRNEDVRRLNEEKLRNLGGDIVKYKAVDRGQQQWKRQLRRGIAADELEICLGARVMLVKNKDLGKGLVNGATGTVVDFVEWTSKGLKSMCLRGVLPKVRFDCGVIMVVKPERWEVKEGETVLATRKQVPLILAWALSIHKCQGMTLEVLHTDLSRAFGYGMVYVALSRVRCLDGLHLSAFNSSKIMAHPKVLHFYDTQFSS